MPSASRPAGNSVGLVSSSGDASYVDAISFKTYENLCRPGFIFRLRQLGARHQLQDLWETPSAWFHLLGTPVVFTPSASRPMIDFVGLVSSLGVGIDDLQQIGVANN
ncbi:hypothetical protein Taro_016343 [Colocasia esculenta]|uniref:Uncharacterized protein n=1 Tax=Colocasia esculenta TaxID=4460 RepID=A0A843UKD8_COLES|nr:hypothetical protein [Colocasia esculenta]